MPYIVLMCGPSCAGKTYLANYIHYLNPKKVTLIGFDAYCVDYGHLSPEEIKQVNYDCPDAYDGHLLAKHVAELKKGNAIDRPIYEFSTHHRKEETVRVEPNDVIIVEGIMTFQYPELVKMADLKVFVDADEHVRFNRRFDRDQKERGRSPESIIYQFNHTVIPMQKIYIDPMRNIADIIIENNSNNGPLPMAKKLVDALKDYLK